MKNNFKTKEEAIEYRDKHQLYNRIPVYIACFQKWSLVFDIKPNVNKEEN
jgi:hypothetical protein